MSGLQGLVARKRGARKLRLPVDAFPGDSTNTAAEKTAVSHLRFAGLPAHLSAAREHAAPLGLGIVWERRAINMAPRWGFAQTGVPDAEYARTGPLEAESRLNQRQTWFMETSNITYVASSLACGHPEGRLCVDG